MAETIFGVLFLVLLLGIAVTDLLGFRAWIERKGWREPKERIDEIDPR